jgi:3-phosphoshikimate 1-carboxyvinyltransferase
MIALVSPCKIEGVVTVAASKSAMQRACALALLNKGTTIIQNPGRSDDDIAALNIIQALGATVIQQGGSLLVKSSGVINGAGEINCGESGLSLRMFAAIAALSDNEIILGGTGSLLKRPVHFFDQVFPLLNVTTCTNNGYLPVTIKGPLIPSNIGIDGSQSSQYLTGLLFAFAKAAKTRITLAVSELKSKPYIDLSLQMLKHFGYSVTHEDYAKFFVDPVAESNKNINYFTEGDWSGAAFLLVAGAIAGNIRVKGLDIYSAQADRAIVDVLAEAGADITVEGSCILVSNGRALKAFEFDATDCPDLFPPLVVLAAYCRGVSVIKGISRLAGKESNRAESLKTVFRAMGVKIVLDQDNMIIHGGELIQPATVSSHHDHRIAMACAVAALGASGDINISGAEAIDKSYPAFFDHLQMLGASVSLTAD